MVCGAQGKLSAVPKWVMCLILRPVFSVIRHSLSFFFSMFVQAFLAVKDYLVKKGRVKSFPLSIFSTGAPLSA